MVGGDPGSEGGEGTYALRVRQAFVREQEEVDEDQGFQLLRKVGVQCSCPVLHPCD